jgi:hypothetical protein
VWEFLRDIMPEVARSDPDEDGWRYGDGEMGLDDVFGLNLGMG